MFLNFPPRLHIWYYNLEMLKTTVRLSQALSMHACLPIMSEYHVYSLLSHCESVVALDTSLAPLCPLLLASTFVIFTPTNLYERATRGSQSPNSLNVGCICRGTVRVASDARRGVIKYSRPSAGPKPKLLAPRRGGKQDSRSLLGPLLAPHPRSVDVDDERLCAPRQSSPDIVHVDNDVLWRTYRGYKPRSVTKGRAH